MNQNEFMSLVKEMRAAQKDYFWNRSRDMLNLSKRLEKEVDAAIQDYECGEQPKQARLI